MVRKGEHPEAAALLPGMTDGEPLDLLCHSAAPLQAPPANQPGDQRRLGWRSSPARPRAPAPPAISAGDCSRALPMIVNAGRTPGDQRRASLKQRRRSAWRGPTMVRVSAPESGLTPPNGSRRCFGHFTHARTILRVCSHFRRHRRRERRLWAVLVDARRLLGGQKAPRRAERPRWHVCVKWHTAPFR